MSNEGGMAATIKEAERDALRGTIEDLINPPKPKPWVNPAEVDALADELVADGASPEELQARAERYRQANPVAQWVPESIRQAWKGGKS